MTDPTLADTAAAPDHSRQRYDFREHLGSGGMADVYRARDTELGRDVAVKVFRATDDTVADLQRREREIRLLSRLNHPGLDRTAGVLPLAAPISSPRACSGEMYAAVPMIAPSLVRRDPSMNWATPKSASFAVRVYPSAGASETRMFSGFTSRCTMACPCT